MKDKEPTQVICPYCNHKLKEISLLMTDVGTVSNKSKKGYECINCKSIFPMFAKKNKDLAES